MRRESGSKEESFLFFQTSAAQLFCILKKVFCACALSPLDYCVSSVICFRLSILFEAPPYFVYSNQLLAAAPRTSIHSKAFYSLSCDSRSPNRIKVKGCFPDTALPWRNSIYHFIPNGVYFTRPQFVNLDQQ